MVEIMREARAEQREREPGRRAAWSRAAQPLRRTPARGPHRRARARDAARSCRPATAAGALRSSGAPRRSGRAATRSSSRARSTPGAPRAAQPFELLSCGVAARGAARRELFGCGEGVYPALPGEHAGALARAAGGTLVARAHRPLRGDALARPGACRRCAELRREGAGAAPARIRASCAASTSAPASRSPFARARTTTRSGSTPLAERREDMLPLAAHFLRRVLRGGGRRRGRLHGRGAQRAARRALAGQRARAARARAPGGAPRAAAAPSAPRRCCSPRDGEQVPSFKEAKRAFETRYVEGLLRRCGGNISRAARLAKKDRKDFYDVIRRTGVDPRSSALPERRPVAALRASSAAARCE